MSVFVSVENGKLYLNPEIITPWFCFFFISNLWYNALWTVVWIREEIVAACILLFLVAQTSIFSIGILARNIAKDNHQLKREKPKLYWLYVALPLNSLGLYATWVVIASMANLGHVLQYVGEISSTQVSHICLGILLTIIILYFILENTVFDHYIRFLLTPYLVVIWASIGIIAKNQNVADSTKNLAFAILGLGCIFLVLRLIIVGLRQKLKPL